MTGGKGTFGIGVMLFILIAILVVVVMLFIASEQIDEMFGISLPPLFGGG